MTDLSKQRCEPCLQASPATAEERDEYLGALLDWHIVDQDGVSQLVKVYELTDFMAALAFANAIGELAESADHHPALLVEWGRLTVKWWTHSLAGLHKNDFIMAAKTDELERR